VVTAASWLSPPPGLTLHGDEIHVWRAWLDQTTGPVDYLAQVLADDERERADRFHFERDRRRFIAGRAGLRSILGLYLKRDPALLKLRYGSRGKPYLVGQPDNATIAFNVAHSGPLAVYGFTRRQAIGVDIEHACDLPDADRVAAISFSAAENAVYRQLPADQKQQAFYLCWTRKEAYIKALGEGVARPLQQFAVSLAPGEPARLLSVDWDPAEISRWFLVSLAPAPGYVGALAVQGHCCSVGCWEYA
jgi:4'-phosphopantetheinyl transferase